jgi:hypothetical protein
MRRLRYVPLVAIALLLLAGAAAFVALRGAIAERPYLDALLELPAQSPKTFASTADAPAGSPLETTVPKRITDRETRYAIRALDRLADRYRYLDDVSVVLGTTPNGEEAVSYYKQGVIMLSTKRTVSIDRLLAHEIWHVIDWRDNGRLDWGEDLPPSDANDYLK